MSVDLNEPAYHEWVFFVQILSCFFKSVSFSACLFGLLIFERKRGYVIVLGQMCYLRLMDFFFFAYFFLN